MTNYQTTSIMQSKGPRVLFCFFWMELVKHPIDNKRLLRNRWSFGCFRLKVRWLNDGNFQARDGGISKIIQKSKYFFLWKEMDGSTSGFEDFWSSLPWEIASVIPNLTSGNIFQGVGKKLLDMSFSQVGKWWYRHILYTITYAVYISI